MVETFKAAALLPFLSLKDGGSSFAQACDDCGWVQDGFDWMDYSQTPEAIALATDPLIVDNSSKLQISQILTVIIREERLNTGSMQAHIDSGLLPNILKRIQVPAAAELRQDSSRFGSQIREVVNRNTFISLALAEGFNAYLPVYDGGVDFILHREWDNQTRKVQLKGRWTIDRKYENRGIWIAFPIGSFKADWYLAPHDEMVALAHLQGKTKTDSWLKGGQYSTGKPSKATIAACQPFRMQSVEAVTTEAASGELLDDASPS